MKEKERKKKGNVKLGMSKYDHYIKWKWMNESES